MRRGVVVSLLALAAIFIGNNRANSDGAVAEGIAPGGAAKGYGISIRVNRPNADEARADALAGCRKGSEHAVSGQPADEGAARARARCEVVTTFSNKCAAAAFDPKDGAPGVGWATGDTQKQADEEALARCRSTAGDDRRDFCKVVNRLCDGSANVANSRDAKVGDTTVSVSPPAGFCEVDKTNKVDSGWLTSMTNLLKGSGVFTIAAFPDCGDLKKARQSEHFITSKVVFSAPFSGIGNASSETLSTTCDELRTKKYSDEDKAEVAKTIKEFSNGNSLTDSVGLGVVEETKGEVCYVATLQKVKTQAGELHPLLALYAVTYLRSNLLFLYQWTPYVDATSIPTALANLKIIYSEFASANLHSCPVGQRFGGNACRPIECSSGERLDGNDCRPIACSSGQRFDGNDCRPIVCSSGQRLEGSTCRQLWNSVAGGITKIRGVPHVAIGYSGLRTSPEEAKESAVGACRQSGDNCKAVGAWDEGCVYITVGSRSRGAGWSSASTVEETTRKCRSNGYTCKAPIGGCVDRPN
jgi:hypothetical protein